MNSSFNLSILCKWNNVLDAIQKYPIVRLKMTLETKSVPGICVLEYHRKRQN